MFRFMLLSCLLLCLSPAAQAAQYTLLVFETAPELARRLDSVQPNPYWRQYAEFGQQLAAAGIMRGGAALEPVEDVRVGESRLSGYFVIETATRAEAEQWTAKVPASLSGGRVVVAPAIQSPTMTTP